MYFLDGIFWAGTLESPRATDMKNDGEYPREAPGYRMGNRWWTQGEVENSRSMGKQVELEGQRGDASAFSL